MVSIGELNKMTKRLFIAPHFADIAWSCGGLIAMDPSNSIVAIVFSQKPSKEILKKYEDYTLEVYRKSEIKYQKMFNLTYEYLDFLHAIGAGRTPSNLFSKDLSQKEKDLVYEIRDRLHDIIDKYRITEIYCPKADRIQVDHVITKEAVNKIAREIHVFYYKDIPDFLPDDNDKSEANLELIKIDISKVLDQKIKAVSLFKKFYEIFYQSLEKIIAKMKKIPYEVYWKVKY